MNIDATMDFSSKNRVTGRTTGLLLKAMSDAILLNGEEVEFVDHFKHTFHFALRSASRIGFYATALGLSMKVRRDGTRVFVSSCIEAYRRPANVCIEAYRKPANVLSEKKEEMGIQSEIRSDRITRAATIRIVDLAKKIVAILDHQPPITGKENHHDE